MSLTSCAAAIVAAVFMIGAAICVRDCYALYRECPSDGIFKLPLLVALGFAVIAIIVIVVYL